MSSAALIQTKMLINQLDDPNLIILDCRFSLDEPSYGLKAFQIGHIPGASFIDLDKDLSSAIVKGVTGRHPLPDAEKLAQRLAELGLNNDSKVVIYDDGPTAYATKMWWTLAWLGKRENVFILNGGFNAWKSEGGTITADETHKPAGDFTGSPDNSLIITAKQLQEQLNDPELSLFDARGLLRFRGEVEPIDPVGGHIPGALCVNFMENLDSDGYFLPADKLKERFAALIADRPIERIISYCGSGVTATHNAFALCLAGYPLVPIYAGSWSEWITDPNRPIAKGD